MTRLAAVLLALGVAVGPASGAGPVGPVVVVAPDDLGGLVARVTAAERAAVAAQDGVAATAAAEDALVRDLALRREEIGRLVAALQAVSRSRGAGGPGLHPEGPLAAARARGMIAALGPGLEAEAEGLAARLRAVAAARSDRTAALAAQDVARGDLEAARMALDAVLAARPVPEATAPVPVALARRAETLGDLAEGIAAQGGAGPDIAAPMALGWPATGRVLRGFRDADGAGVRRPGLVVEAGPRTLVTAPAAGQVRYAGPFLDYGYVVVIAPRADVLVTLAGLARLDVAMGAALAAGDLVGALGGAGRDEQEHVIPGQGPTGETPMETLYIEIRHGQEAVDPAPWFAADNGQGRAE